MGATNFAGPVYAGGVLLGPGGLPVSTNGYQVYFVDPINGAVGNPGTSEAPVDSIATAYGKCVSGRGDVVCLVGGPGSDGGTNNTNRLSANFDWAKDNTHLIGLCAPTMVSQRSRIASASTPVDFTPFFTISADGCRFENVMFFDAATTNPQCVKVTGQRNYFNNVHFAGMGAATGADDATACSLFLSGGDENTFDNCYIGLDTIERSTTNAEIMLEGGATRNIFRDCFIASFADNAGHLFVKIDGSGDIDRFVYFKNCFFYNAIESTGTAMTQAMNVHNTCGGMVIIHDCGMIGATDWCEADNGNVYITNAAPTAGTSGIAVAVTR